VTKTIIGAAALLMLSACGQQIEEQPVSEEPKELRSGVSLANMNTSVRPGDDFFSYVNGTWVETTEIPADKSKYGTFDQLRDEAQEAVKLIIEESASGDFEKGTDEQKVGDLYKSFLDVDGRNAKGIDPLRPELEQIDAIQDYNDLVIYFAASGKRGIDSPVGFGQNPDFKNPKEYMILAAQSGLGLPDREYYLKTDEASAEIRASYVEHIEKMFGLAGFADGAAAAESIMAVETRLAEEHMSKENARDWATNYNKILVSDLAEVMPNFNWTAYLETAGVADLEAIVFLMTDYLKALDKIIVDTDLDTWKTYLAWNALNNAASRLTAALDDQNFEFYGKTLSGTQEQRAMWRRGVNSVNGLLGEVVGKVYVKRHFPPEAKERMIRLVANLVRAYEKSIKELDWMTQATKAEALDKLSKFTTKIGYPDEWRDYNALEIRADDYYGNLERAAVAEHERQMNRQGTPVDRSEWVLTPQTVNAGYVPPLNEIIFPAAILQPPFFDLEAEDAINYGAIGAGIGHEIGHGFDDSGSAFDGDGVLRNWWTDEDRTEFEKRTARLVEQYDAFKPFEDLSVNGEFTLGENIGDLGGISIGLLAYQMSLEGAESPVIDGFTGVQRVFLGFGQIWSGKYRDESLRLLIGTDPHSPVMYRANGSVRNVPAFYEAFDVSEGDALYLAPEDRVKIW
jgi:putative endopeptidase